MKNEIAISVKNISKTFRIPHEKVTSLRGAFVRGVSPLWKRGARGDFFEEFKALDDVSFEVKKGEFFGIIGRNGSGKSTLLKILAGIYQADKGSVEINGMISPFLELGIGFNPELSGRDNIYLNATVLGLSKKEIDQKFDDIVKFSELERFIDQKLKNYSSGMQVRLAFSVSIHANRDILLMDEVLAVGDSNFQQKCIKEFIKYRENGNTIILVSHDISAIDRYCDRAMILEAGRSKNIGNATKISHFYIADSLESQADSCRDGQKFEWINPGNKFINKFFTPVKLAINKKNKNINDGIIDVNEDVYVEITCEIGIPNKHLSIGYELRDDRNNLIYWSFFTDLNFGDDNLLKKGVHSLKSSLPFGLLNEGEYRIILIAAIHFKEWILQPESVTPNITFFINGITSQSPFWKIKRPGILAPALRWEKIE